MARQQYVTTKTRKAGSEEPVKLDINQARLIGKKTKRLIASGVRRRDAKKQARDSVSKRVES